MALGAGLAFLMAVSLTGCEMDQMCIRDRDLVGYLGADVEVARGAKIPFYPRAGYYDATHGSEGLGDVTLPAAENVPFTKETAPELSLIHILSIAGSLGHGDIIFIQQKDDGLPMMVTKHAHEDQNSPLYIG